MTINPMLQREDHQEGHQMTLEMIITIPWEEGLRTGIGGTSSTGIAHLTYHQLDHQKDHLGEDHLEEDHLEEGHREEGHQEEGHPEEDSLEDHQVEGYQQERLLDHQEDRQEEELNRQMRIKRRQGHLSYPLHTLTRRSRQTKYLLGMETWNPF